MRQYIILIGVLFFSCSLFAEDTAIRLYRPYANTTPVIKKAVQGNCWQQSARIKREDAWRCVADGTTYDPCFVKEHGDHKEAVCPESPWATSNINILLSAPVDNAHHVTLDISQAYPWGVELVNGEKCLAIDQGEMHDGLVVRYRCDSHHVLFGYLQRCKTPWTMLQKQQGGNVETVVIATAWF